MSPPLASTFGNGWGDTGRIRFDASFFRTAGDVALGGIIFLAPLVLGGRHPIGRLVYIVLVLSLVACWVGERFCKSVQPWKSSGVEWILMGGAILLIVQTMCLSTEFLNKISPARSDLLPSWSESLSMQLQLQNWSQISLTPHATWLALGVYIAHVALFLTLVQRFQQADQIPRTLRWIALAATGMAGLALLQFASGTEKFVWIFDHPSRPANMEVSGAFSNSNHFAHFLALGIGPLIWWLSRLKPRTDVVAGPTGNRFGGQESVNDWRNIGLFCGIPVVLLAGLMSNSRGGIIVMFLATLVSVALLAKLGLLSHKAWLALGGIGVLVLAGLTFHGYREVRNELATLTSGSINAIDDSGARQKIWAANWEVIQRFPILGTGVGSHAEVYPRFFPHRSAVEFTHAESGYIQVLTETGAVGGCLVLFGLIACLRWTLGALKCHDKQLASAAAAIGSGLAVSAVHSLFDFPWYLTSCMSFVIIFAAAACCLFQHHVAGDLRNKKSSLSTKANEEPATSWPLGGLIWIAILVGFSLAHLRPALGAPHWDRYLKLALNSNRSLHHQLLSGADRKQRSEKIAAQSYENTRQMAFHLQNCLHHHPTHPRANSRMAANCIRLFENAQKDSQNAMGLDQIRDAAIASQFPTQEKLKAWLEVAIGEPKQLLDKALYHCQLAHRITPVDGRSYIYRSQLAFLERAGATESVRLLSAAEHVRPNDAFVLFQKGRDSASKADLEATLVTWARSFKMSETYRNEIIGRLGPHLPAPLLINAFDPDPQGLEQLYSYYKRRKMMIHASIVGPLVVKNILNDAEHESGVPAGKIWHRCRSIHRFLGQNEEALHCAQQATVVAPNWYDARMTLADEYMAQEYYANAIEQYQWCQKRKPFEAKIRQRLNIAQTLVAKQEFERNQGLDTQAPAMLSTPPIELPHIPQMSQQPQSDESRLRF